LIAATATFALKAGLWFRRGHLVMVISSLAAIMPPWRGKSTYPGCSVFPNRLSPGFHRNLLMQLAEKIRLMQPLDHRENYPVNCLYTASTPKPESSRGL
jgi:hypothetical protein